MTDLASPQVPVSWGELLDKVTILEIKRERIRRADARINVETEHRLLWAIASRVCHTDRCAALMRELREVNEALWEIEDKIREHEAASDFGPGFVALARSVYIRNDERAAIKRRINDLLGSELVEEKSYAGFAQAAADQRPIFFAQPAN